MQKTSIILGLLFILLMQVNAADGKNFVQQKEDIKTVPGEFIVKFKAPDGDGTQVSFSKLSMVAAKYNVKSNEQIFAEAQNSKLKKKLNLHNVFLFNTDKSADIQAIVDELNNDPSIEYAEPVYLHKLESVPNDSLYSQQYFLPQIKAPEAWDIQTNSSNVIIGIIDSGVDWDHPDLVNNIWNNTGEIADNGIDDDNNGYIDDIRGWDFVASTNSPHADEDGRGADNDPMDFDGHGTHVAGIAGATTNNGIGIASASYGATIMPLRCGYHAADGNGYVPSLFAAEAYIYAADNGAHITNQSSGNSGQTILDAAYYAFLNGVLIVESAGNGNAVTPSVLGSQSWVISVASVNQNDKKTYYSSFGEYVTVSSPGGELFVGNDAWGILSTIVHPSTFFGGELYTKFQGTSMAAPLVASAAALVVANEPNIDVVDLFTRIVETADNIDALNPSHAGLLGSGRINLHRALTENISANPYFKIVKSVINDASGNNNGFLDAGEQVELKITLRNVWQSANNVNVQLQTDEPWPISITNANSTISNVGGILDTLNWEAEVTFAISAATDAVPITVPFQIVISEGSFSQTIEYNIATSPRVLFVADFEHGDNNAFDYSHIYKDAFASGLISYDYVHHLDVDITQELLDKYSTVVWACEWHFPSLDSDDRVAIKSFLDNGGALFLSGQDIAWDLNENADNRDKDFLNNYLKVNYVADDAGTTKIFGVDNDPITDGMNINFYQKGREADQQFPDVLEPINDAVSILNYGDGKSGAIRYAGVYDLVFFGFGGFESIDLEENRNKIMKNIIGAFSGMEYSINILTDTEVTDENYKVNGEVIANSSTVSNAYLYWIINDVFYRVSMTDDGDGKFSGEIPAQSSGTYVTYFMYATATDGNYILSAPHTFHVGADVVPPVIEIVSEPLKNSISIYGPAPYQLHTKMSDNIGIDTATAKIYFTVNDAEPYQFNLLTYSPETELYSGTFSFASALEFGDKVSYYFSVKDSSSNANQTSTEVIEYSVDTLQVLDEFENDLSDWDLVGNWGLSSNKKNGKFSLTDSPGTLYENNLDISATYKTPFNLSPFKFAKVEFYLRSIIEKDRDSLFVEVSNDNGASWNEVFGYSKTSIFFRLQSADLSDYTGIGNESVKVRFRMATDSTEQRDGVWIDDVSISVSYNPVGVNDEIVTIPTEYTLLQNYPNPFNPSTIISYTLPSESKVKLKIYNTLGEVVATLMDGVNNAGVHRLEWDASNLASGIYFYRISAESINDSKKFNSVKKMLLLK